MSRGIIGCVIVCCAMLWGCVGPPKPVPTKETSAEARSALTETPLPRQARSVRLETETGTLRVAVELALTREARRKGLMGRESLAEGHGMLFVFDVDEVQTFWMRNTLIPLDMIFIAGPASGAGAKVVGIVHNAPPHSTQLRSVKAPSRFVLEVPGGWSRAHGLTAGAKVYFEPVGGLGSQ